MKAAGVSEVKAKLSEYIARVRGGEEVVITDRGRPVARLVSAAASEPALAELERRGLIRTPTASLPDGFLDRPLPKAEKGSVLEALLEERREGR